MMLAITSGALTAAQQAAEGARAAQEIAEMQQAVELAHNVVPIVAFTMGGLVLIAAMWLILHYVTKWRQAKTLTSEDEALLDDLHDTARRLDDRLMTIERIVAADRLSVNS